MASTKQRKKSSKPPAACITSGPPERVHDLVGHSRRHPLHPFFAPASVALVGATENPGSVGRTVLENLIAGGFAGPIFPVNPKRPTVLGLPAYPGVKVLPQIPELVVIVTPATSVPAIVRECAEAGVKHVVIISAGFKEVGPEGVALEQDILATARKAGMRIIGPNCLGVMAPTAKLNATFAAGMARPGSVAFLSQSGALCTAVLDWSLRENVGFSAFVSLGSMLDVSWGDLIYQLGDDPNTSAIVMYMESVGNAGAFLSAAREVALTKPIILIKVGRTEAAAKAAASHTGSLTGSDAVLDAAFRRVGVLRVDTIEELFDMAEVLGKQPRPKGPRLAIVTNAGGPGALATDRLIGSGGQLSQLSADTLAALNQLLPPHWSHGNPVDVLGDAGAERYGKTIDIVSKDPNVDGLLVILTPQAMTESTATAAALRQHAALDGKPIIASWMGGDTVLAGEDVLNQANVPTFKYPDRAARAFEYMWRYSLNLRSLYETPALAGKGEVSDADRQEVAKVITAARRAGRTILTEHEAKRILAAYHIPTTETCVAKTAADAVKAAGRIKGPVVLKLHSETLTHKTDVGGVKLNLSGADAVRKAFAAIRDSVKEKAGGEHFHGVCVQPMVRLDGYELILGSSLDPQFGPVLLFGSGGQLVEVFKDRTLGLPPLNATLARRMLEQTKIYTALKGVRGRQSVDLAALESLLVRFSQLVVEQPWIKELDINPLLASPEGLIALDARVILHPPETAEDQLPTTAIRPYPAQYVSKIKLHDGTTATLRPIRPEDEPLLAEFHHTLSERSVYFRFQKSVKLDERIAHDRLVRICFNDYHREIALVVEHRANRKQQPEIIAIGRLSKLHGRNEGELTMLVSDVWQRRGLGTLLIQRLVQVARDEQLDRVRVRVEGNEAMTKIGQRLGFTALPGNRPGEQLLELTLG